MAGLQAGAIQSPATERWSRAGSGAGAVARRRLLPNVSLEGRKDVVLHDDEPEIEAEPEQVLV